MSRDNLKLILKADKPTPVVRSIVRIEQEADPIGILMKIARGEPIETFVLDHSGKPVKQYRVPDLKEQLSAAKWLGDRVMPKVAVTHHTTAEDGKTIDHNTFARIVEKAAGET